MAPAVEGCLDGINHACPWNLHEGDETRGKRRAARRVEGVGKNVVDGITGQIHKDIRGGRCEEPRKAASGDSYPGAGRPHQRLFRGLRNPGDMNSGGFQLLEILVFLSPYI